MKYQNWLIPDVETIGRKDAEQYVKSAANLNDPAKIAASIEERKADLGLDINGLSIVCIGYWPSTDVAPTATVCKTETQEMNALLAFWAAWKAVPNMHRMFVGYKARTYDLQVLIRRSQLLGVPCPRVSLKRYHGGDVFDLLEELTFFNEQGVHVVPRTLDVMCDLFRLRDLPVDAHCGADVAQLARDGHYDAILSHNMADLHKTRALAERLGVIGEVALVRKMTKLDIAEGGPFDGAAV